ncbi:CBM96 family carbohydrate-binding protein, partial [Arthrobacter sp. C152]
MSQIRALAASIIVFSLLVLVSLLGVGGFLSAVAVSNTLTLAAVADTYISTASPDSNYGAATTLAVSGAQYHVLLRFNVSIPTGATVTGVNLRVYSKRTANSSLVIHPAETMWDESTVTYATRPTWHPEELARTASLRANKYVATSLPTSSIPGIGPVSFELNTSSDAQGSLSSRETSNPPQLVITYTPAASPTPTATTSPTPTLTATTSPSPTPTATSTTTASPSP